MSELYRHLLIPKDAAFVPERYQLAAFFDELEALGALPKGTEFIVITNSGKTRAIAQNPTTGEVYYGPDLKIRRFSDPQPAIDSMDGTQINEVWAEAKGPATIFPFELHRAHVSDDLWSGPYSFTIRCKLRHEITHFLHSAFGCKCDLKLNEPATFDNPWNNQPIQTSGLAYARFWIEFGIGDWLMPMISDSLDILDSRLVTLANNIFRIEFTQGCICNDVSMEPREGTRPIVGIEGEHTPGAKAPFLMERLGRAKPEGLAYLEAGRAFARWPTHAMRLNNEGRIDGAPGTTESLNASFQPANATSNLTWGFAPGYKIAGLQPGTLQIITIAAMDRAPQI